MSDELTVTVPVSIGSHTTPPSTRGNQARKSLTNVPRGVRYRLSARQEAVAHHVAQLGQVSAGQLGAVEYHGLKSLTPRKRDLKRLTELGVLVPLEIQIRGGDGGGSTNYIYQLGREGGRLLGVAKKCPRYGEYDPHMHDIAECFVKVKQEEQAGSLKVLRYLGEDAAYLELTDRAGTIKLTPDLFVDFGTYEPRRRLSWWLEVERSDKGDSYIAGKCARYLRAYRVWSANTNTYASDVFPRVVFVAITDGRRRAIERVIAKQPDEARAKGLFQVCLMSSFPQAALTGVESVDFQG